MEAPPTNVIGYLIPDQQGFGAGLEPRSGHWAGIFLSGKAQLGSQLGSGSSPSGKAVCMRRKGTSDSREHLIGRKI